MPALGDPLEDEGLQDLFQLYFMTKSPPPDTVPTDPYQEVFSPEPRNTYDSPLSKLDEGKEVSSLLFFEQYVKAFSAAFFSPSRCCFNGCLRSKAQMLSPYFPLIGTFFKVVLLHPQTFKRPRIAVPRRPPQAAVWVAFPMDRAARQFLSKTPTTRYLGLSRLDLQKSSGCGVRLRKWMFKCG